MKLKSIAPGIRYSVIDEIWIDLLVDNLKFYCWRNIGEKVRPQIEVQLKNIVCQQVNET